MSGSAAMAPDAIEIHPGTPNIYYEQGVVKGEDTKPLMANAAFTVETETYCSRQPHLHLEPDCGCAYFEENGAHDDSVQEHRPASAPRDDRSRHRH